MVRTQIYLSESEHKHLKRLSAQTGRGQSELIRQAVDQMVLVQSGHSRRAALQGAKGIWAQRHDLPDFKRLRRELDRSR